VPAQHASAAPAGCGVSGEAYATQASALGLGLGKVADVILPPGGSATAAPVNLSVLSTALGLLVLPSTSTDTSTPSHASSTSTPGVSNLGLTSGLTLPSIGAITALSIQADAIAVSAHSSSTGGPATNSGVTTVSNLVIGSNAALNGTIAPN